MGGLFNTIRYDNGTNAPGASATPSFNAGSLSYFNPNTLFIVHLAIPSATITCTGITGMVSGTFALLNRQVNAAGLTSELWIGYNLPVFQGSTFTATLSASAQVLEWHGYFEADNGAPVTSLPANTATGATGSSTTADPGTVTPAVNDIVISRACWLNTTAASGFTDSPAGRTWITDSAVSTGHPTIRHAGGDICAVSTSAAKRVTNISSGQWAAHTVKITPPAAASSAAFVAKGLDTYLLDAGSSY